MTREPNHEEEEEEVEAEALADLYPYCLRITPGEVFLLQADVLADKLGADGFQLTQEDGLFYLKDGQWHLIPLAGPTNKRPKLSSV
jgi:hypothetical protein